MIDTHEAWPARYFRDTFESTLQHGSPEAQVVAFYAMRATGWEIWEEGHWGDLTYNFRPSGSDGPACTIVPQQTEKEPLPTHPCPTCRKPVVNPESRDSLCDWCRGDR